ncbi:MAG: NFACT family protein [Clostridia bacterium]|nr:NFACT family protein [Clostridia bacterium]
MALDGAFLACLRQELADTLQDARIDKIHQPGREELVMALRWKGGNEKLYLSAGANAPRLHFTTQTPENPAQPPMFCMLLRKRLTGGRLCAIRQEGWERALYLDFDCINELGDPIRLTLAVEIMGRHSNIILIGQDGIIIDAIKRVDPAMSSVRPILPGLRYEVPPPAEGLDLSVATPDEVVAAIRGGKDGPLSKAIQQTVTGLSPLSCREIAFRATAGEDTPVRALTDREWGKLADCLTRTRDAVLTGERRVPYLLVKADGTPQEFSFQTIIQYGPTVTGQEMESFSALLDAFYARRAAAERMKVRSHDLLRVLLNASERVKRKLNNQRQELAAAADRDKMRLYGDLINAGMHLIPAGATSAELINYYDENCATITVPLDPALSAAANAQKYYKDYRKAQTAERILTQRIAEGEQELIYLDSVFDSLTRATSARELEELRRELEEQGYLRRQKGKQKPPPPMKALTFRSDDGFTILVGRNNLENDRLTLKTARGCDVWFHTKNIPGSHVIVVTEGQTPPDRTLEQAAVIAATHSKAADSVQVPVDYTAVKFVKKPSGAKPGMVIYTDNRTAYVNPDVGLCERLKVE